MLTPSLEESEKLKYFLENISSYQLEHRQPYNFTSISKVTDLYWRISPFTQKLSEK